MGVVWAAVNELTSGEVALKLILQSTEELRLRLLREARVCGGLKHRNVIEVHDVGQTEEGDPFLVMQLLHGETLAEFLKCQRRLDPPVAAQIARDVARALAAVHAAGVIHRDLKPANIFLHHEAGADGPTVKVLDFGVSKNLSMSNGLVTIDGGAIGSPAYMSPEQARAARDLDQRADIWSLGVVLFELLTGVRPFQGDSNQVILNIIQGDIPLVSRHVRLVDPGLVSLVSRCLERDRARRIGSAAELAELLQRHMSPTPSAPDEIADTKTPSSSLEWNEESDAPEEPTIAIAPKTWPVMIPRTGRRAAPPQEMVRGHLGTMTPPPGVGPGTNLVSPGSRVERGVDLPAPERRPPGPRGTVVTSTASRVLTYLPKDTAGTSFSGILVYDSETDLRTDLGPAVTTVAHGPASPVPTPALAAAPPPRALAARAVLATLGRLLGGRKALLAVVAGGAALLALGIVGARQAGPGPSIRPAEATIGEPRNQPAPIAAPAPPTAAPTVVVSSPSLPPPVIAASSPPVEPKPPVKKNPPPAGGTKVKQKPQVSTPGKGKPSWLPG
jgi:serine/threonine-protein kinase